LPEEPFGGVDPPGDLDACWCYCSSHDPLGHSISAGVETTPGPDSARSAVSDSRLAAQLLIVNDWTGHDPGQRNW